MTRYVRHIEVLTTTMQKYGAVVHTYEICESDFYLSETQFLQVHRLIVFEDLLR